LSGSFANTKLVLKNIAVWMPFLNNMVGVDGSFVSAMDVDRCSVKTFAPATAGQAPYLNQLPSSTPFQASLSRGFQFPVVTNNDDSHFTSFTVEGCEVGFTGQDHLTGSRAAVIYSDLAMLIDLTTGPSGTSHAVAIQNLSAEAFNGAIHTNGGGGSLCYVEILLDAETPGGSAPSYDVSDSSNVLHGSIRWWDPLRTSGAPTLIQGASPHLTVTNGRL
jgi:hypothetical protein